MLPAVWRRCPTAAGGAAALGMPRERVALVARLPQRPLLVTVARDGEVESAMLRRLHRLLLSTVAAALENHAAVNPPFCLPA